MIRKIAPVSLALLLSFSHYSYANTVLYGEIRYDYRNTKTSLLGANPNKNTRHSNMTDRGSRIGFRGGEQLGDDFQLIFNLEWGFNGMEGGNNGDGFRSRLAYIGLKSEQFGTIQIGRMQNPFTDTIYGDSVGNRYYTARTYAVARAIESQLAGGIGSSMLSDIGAHNSNDFISKSGSFGHNMERVGNTISYFSPTWSGFSFTAFAIIDDDLNFLQHKKHADLYSLNLKYKHDSGFYAKLGYIEGYTSGSTTHGMTIPIINKNRKISAIGAQLGFITDQYSFSAGYVDSKLANVTQISQDNRLREHRKDNAKGWNIGASYSFGDNYIHTLMMTYGEVKYTGDNEYHHYTDTGTHRYTETNSMKPKEKGWTVGYHHKLSNRTILWLEYDQIKESGYHRSTGYKDENTPYHHSHGFNGKNTVVSIGIRHIF